MLEYLHRSSSVAVAVTHFPLKELRERNYKLAEAMNELEQTTKKMLSNASGPKVGIAKSGLDWTLLL